MEMNWAEPRLYADECDLKPRSPIAGSRWDWNNIFVSGTYDGAFPISHAHTLWVSIHLTQDTPSLCLPSLPGRDFLWFKGHHRCHLFSGPHVQLPQLCSPFWYSPLLEQDITHPTSPARLWALGAGLCLIHLYGTTQGAQWHTGCVCFLDHLSVYCKHDHWLVLELATCVGLTTTGCSPQLLLDPSLSLGFPLSSIPHCLSSLGFPTPSVSCIDLDRRSLFLAELSPGKGDRAGSMANEQLSRRAQVSVCLFTSWHHHYQLRDFVQVNLTSLCLSCCNCKKGNNNTCLSDTHLTLVC